MNKLSLATRLFLSHLLVMIIGLGTFILIAKVSSPRIFILRLEQLEKRGFLRISSARTYLIEGFETAWDRSAGWSFIIGATTAVGLSYWLSRRIMQPLNQMKEVTQKLAAGDLQVRIPTSHIPDLARLESSFNQMANSLEGVEQRRRDLISDMSHELRTPLTIVRGYLEQLANGEIEPSLDLYLLLVRETRRLERLIRDLQELSKAEAGSLSINRQSVLLPPLLDSLVARFSEQLLEDGPILQYDYSSNLPPVLADLERTEQILVNLLGNAIRYTEKGSITLSAWQETHQVWVAVKDTGIGIAPEDLPRLFERFWRADRSRARYSGGTGIGLAIARHLVELQNGQIEVESKLNQGSVFRFSLPIAKSYF